MQRLLLLALLLAPEPITQITLERQPCFGSCPVDKVVLRSDGTAEYAGDSFVTRIGKYTGKIIPDDFRKLASLIEEKKFTSLRPNYSSPVTCSATFITSVKWGEKKKTVSNYANAAPKELQDIEKAIAERIEKIEWTKAE